MGTAKKEAVRKERQGKVGDGMANVKTKGENFYRYERPTLGCIVYDLDLVSGTPKRSRP